MAKDPRHYRTDMETPEGQRKNAELRKGMKRPEYGPWPLAKSEALKKKKIPKEYRGNTNSEGGIPFGRKPR